MALTYSRRRLSSKQREELYDRCRGNNEFPTCNLCGLPVDGTREPWDESHEGAPHALGGTETGVAHRVCNQRDNHLNVTPMVAKAKRGRQKHIGAFQTRHKLPGGRGSGVKKKIGGGVVARERRVPKLSLDDLNTLLAVTNPDMRPL